MATRARVADYLNSRKGAEKVEFSVMIIHSVTPWVLGVIQKVYNKASLLRIGMNLKYPSY